MGAKLGKLTLFMYKAQIYTAHKQIYRIFVVLTFSLGVAVAIGKKWSKNAPYDGDNGEKLRNTGNRNLPEK